MSTKYIREANTEAETKAAETELADAEAEAALEQ